MSERDRNLEVNYLTPFLTVALIPSKAGFGVSWEIVEGEREAVPLSGDVKLYGSEETDKGKRCAIRMFLPNQKYWLLPVGRKGDVLAWDIVDDKEAFSYFQPLLWEGMKGRLSRLKRNTGLRTRDLETDFSLGPEGMTVLIGIKGDGEGILKYTRKTNVKRRGTWFRNDGNGGWVRTTSHTERGGILINAKKGTIYAS